ncbi:hypothetical protein NDU88_005031 [Pleurodeles waltl]|uniref:Uncharacterized protein n=1 Tax=Pleurodeles waltl TaxID=8319 RepID=A0AAV7TVZ1_PLEWA|nr:hypothetical protein NDU88_005031 [Pleurodeles waltl]
MIAPSATAQRRCFLASRREGGGGRQPQAEEHDDRRDPCWIADDSCGGSHQKPPLKEDAGPIFVTPGPENQEGGEPNTPATL